MGIDIIFKIAGIGIITAVANQILKNAQTNQQPQVQAIDYSKFNRSTLGIDLYSSRTNVDLQKQIAMTQAGLYAQAINIAKLNSQAAMNLYSAATVQKNVELTQSIQTTELNPPPKVEQQSKAVQLFNISDKNSHSSNGFNPFKTNEEEVEKGENGDNIISLFK